MFEMRNKSIFDQKKTFPKKIVFSAIELDLREKSNWFHFSNFLLELYFLDLFSNSNSPCSNVEKKVDLNEKNHLQKKSSSKHWLKIELVSFV